MKAANARHWKCKLANSAKSYFLRTNTYVFIFWAHWDICCSTPVLLTAGYLTSFATGKKKKKKDGMELFIISRLL